MSTKLTYSTKSIAGKFTPTPRRGKGIAGEVVGYVNCIFDEDPQQREKLFGELVSKRIQLTARKLNAMKGKMVQVIVQEDERVIQESEVYTVIYRTASGRGTTFDTGGIFLTPITE